MRGVRLTNTIQAAACAYIAACGGDSPHQLAESFVSDASSGQMDGSGSTADGDQSEDSRDASNQLIDDGGGPAVSGTGVLDAGPAPDASAGDAMVTLTMLEAAHYESMVEGLFDERCSSCHSQITQGQRPACLEHGFILNMLSAQAAEYAVSTCMGIPYVVPHHPEQSYLYLALTPNAPCGQKHSQFDAQTVQEIADWITAARWLKAYQGFSGE